jgi:glycosyltransferase 2 family protein
MSKHASDLPIIEWGPRILSLTFICVGLCIFIQVSGGVLFWILIKNQGVKSHWVDWVIIHSFTTIGKYLPGNVFHLVGRAALGKNLSIPVNAVVVATFFETISAVFMAVCVAFAGIMYFDYEFDWLIDKIPLALLLWCCTALIAVFLFGMAHRKIRDWISKNRSLMLPQCVLPVSLIHLTHYLIFGICLALLQEGFVVEENLSILSFTWGFALAWVAGLVVPGAPGGIGIREMILFSIYGSVLGQGPAAAMFLYMRLITTAADVGAWAVAALLNQVLGRRLSLFKPSGRVGEI